MNGERGILVKEDYGTVGVMKIQIHSDAREQRICGSGSRISLDRSLMSSFGPVQSGSTHLCYAQTSRFQDGR